MKTVLYTFSGSGNSILAARHLSEKLDGRIVSIPRMMNAEIIVPEEGVVGIIFPVYYANMGGSGLPLIVSRFIRKLSGLDTKYIFAVCTHGGDPYMTIGTLRDRIACQGGRLSAGFAVRMGLPYAAKDKILHHFFGKPLPADAHPAILRHAEVLASARARLDEISRYVTHNDSGHFDTPSDWKRRLLWPYMRMQFAMGIRHSQQMAQSDAADMESLIPFEDRSFFTSDACRGCGTCVRVCPVQNIVLVDGRPAWQHHCETCFACYQWCPHDAIRGEVLTYERKFHYPEISLKDFLLES